MAVWTCSVLMRSTPSTSPCCLVGEQDRAAGWTGRPQRTSEWLAMKLHSLKHDGSEAVLEELRRLGEHASQDDEMHKTLAFLEKRKDRMQYLLYQQDG
jgi:hypothetical protein